MSVQQLYLDTETVMRYALDNGHILLYVHRPNCGYAQIGIQTPVGSYMDIVPGIMHFYEHMICRSIDHHVDAIEPSDPVLQAMLVKLGGFCNWTSTNITAKTEPTNAVRVLSFLLDNFRNPTLSESVINIEKEIILNEGEYNNSNESAMKDLGQIVGMHNSSSWMPIGDTKAILSINKQLLETVGSLVRGSPITICLIGEVDIQEVIHVVERLSPPIVEKTKPSFSKPIPGLYTFKSKKVSSLDLQWMLPVPTKDEISAFIVLCELLSSMRGYFMQHARQRLGKIYAMDFGLCRSMYEFTHMGFQRLRGKQLRQELYTLITELCDSPELETHIRTHIDAVKQALILEKRVEKSLSKNTLDKLLRFSRDDYHFSSPYEERILSVQPDEVVNLAKRILNPSTHTAIYCDPA